MVNFTKRLFLGVLLFLVEATFSQVPNNIFSADIDNFWVAYDSIQKTDDLSRKLKFINDLYIDRGSKGLEAFMKLRNYSDSLYVNLIEKYPKFWKSVRPNTLSVKTKTEELQRAVRKLGELYPELKDAGMYFTIGGLRSGGTVSGNMVLIGAEIGTANPTTDVSEFKNDWLKNVFGAQSLDHITSLNIHEYVHTQQKPNDSDILLHQVIREGACDFITELVLEMPLQRTYLTYGKKHFHELKQQLKEEMFSSSYTNWLYNGGQRGETADLGYYMGYEICKSYYGRAKDKRKAIKEIITLDYNNEQLITRFLRKSGFYEDGFNKEKLVKAYQAKQPFIVEIAPLVKGKNTIDVKTKELRIVFSRKMNPRNYSLNYSEKGKGAWPIKDVIGFENDDHTLVLELALKPDTVYEFVVNCKGFSSHDDYPLKGGEYVVGFRTD